MYTRVQTFLKNWFLSVHNYALNMSCAASLDELVVLANELYCSEQGSLIKDYGKSRWGRFGYLRCDNCADFSLKVSLLQLFFNLILSMYVILYQYIYIYNSTWSRRKSRMILGLSTLTAPHLYTALWRRMVLWFRACVCRIYRGILLLLKKLIYTNIFHILVLLSSRRTIPLKLS